MRSTSNTDTPFTTQPISAIALMMRFVPMYPIAGIRKILRRPQASSSLSWLSPRRLFATSAQKRKWQKEALAGKKKRQGPKNDNSSIFKLPSKLKNDDGVGSNWRPFLILGVFPVVMSGLVVLGRDDLRYELEEKGIGRTLRDFRNWRTTRAMELEEKKRQNLRERSNDNGANTSAPNPSSSNK